MSKEFKRDLETLFYLIALAIFIGICIIFMERTNVQIEYMKTTI